MLKQIILSFLDIFDEELPEVEPVLSYEDAQVLKNLGLNPGISHEQRLYRASQDPSGSLDDFDEDLFKVTARPY